MARSHSLMVWSVVFGFLAAASLYAAEPKEPKQKHAKASVEKPKLYHSDDPFGPSENHPVLSPKKLPKPAMREMRPGENVKAIEDALAGSTEMVFVEVPLQDVVNYLKDRHRIEIKIDNKALNDVGIGTDSPVTISLKGISLRSSLNLMLKELSLAWLIKDEVLLITTPEEADNQLSTKLYEVADLVTCRDKHDAPWEDYDTLIDIITPTIKSTSWDCVGGVGSINGATLGTAKVLVVSQTREVHEEIADLLAKIREIAKKTPNAGTPRRDRPAPKISSGQMGPTVSGYPDPLAPRPKAASKNPADTGSPKQEKQPKQPPKPEGQGGVPAA